MFVCFPFLFFGFPKHVEFLGQGSDSSHSCDLSRSCSNAGSLTHWVRPGIKPASLCAEIPWIPLCHSGNSSKFFNFFFFILLDQNWSAGFVRERISSAHIYNLIIPSTDLEKILKVDAQKVINWISEWKLWKARNRMERNKRYQFLEFKSKNFKNRG